MNPGLFGFGLIVGECMQADPDALLEYHFNVVSTSTRKAEMDRYFPSPLSSPLSLQQSPDTLFPGRWVGDV